MKKLGMSFGAALVLLALLSVLAVPQVHAADRCWTSKSSYAVGESITIYVSMSTTDLYYYLVVWKPGGTYTRQNIGYGPGTTYITGTAGTPTGQRTVQLYNNLGLVATCYFTITSGGGGGGGGADRCWTSKSSYAVGESITIYASLSKTDIRYTLYVIKPGGAYTTYNLGYGPGTKYVTGTAGTPTGQRTVRLYNQLGQSVYCYFTITGGGGGGGYTVTVYAKDYYTGAVIPGAYVYLDGRYMGRTGYAGSLTITGVSYGRHTIECSYGSMYGYKSVTVTTIYERGGTIYIYLQ